MCRSRVGLDRRPAPGASGPRPVGLVLRRDLRRGDPGAHHRAVAALGHRLHRRDDRRRRGPSVHRPRSARRQASACRPRRCGGRSSGFSNGTVWLIFAAFVFAMGYEKTGLGRRVALLMVKWLGHRTLGLGYAVALSDLLLAPVHAVQHRAQRRHDLSGDPQHPRVVRGQQQRPPQPFGTAVMWIAFATTCITSSMFVTALAPNLFLLDLARTTTGVVDHVDGLVRRLPADGRAAAARRPLAHLPSASARHGDERRGAALGRQCAGWPWDRSAAVSSAWRLWRCSRSRCGSSPARCSIPRSSR